MRDKGERRNKYLNLAWTGPVDNTSLQVSIPFEKVVNMAADMFLDAAAATAEAATAKTPGTDNNYAGMTCQPQRQAMDILQASKKKPWKIPRAVERGFERAICVTNAFAVPELGKFKRLGLYVVVNAVWLAYYWAKVEENTEAATALRNLSLD